MPCAVLLQPSYGEAAFGVDFALSVLGLCAIQISENFVFGLRQLLWALFLVWLV